MWLICWRASYQLCIFFSQLSLTLPYLTLLFIYLFIPRVWIMISEFPVHNLHNLHLDKKNTNWPVDRGILKIKWEIHFWPKRSNFLEQYSYITLLENCFKNWFWMKVKVHVFYIGHFPQSKISFSGSFLIKCFIITVLPFFCVSVSIWKSQQMDYPLYFWNGLRFLKRLTMGVLEFLVHIL